MSNVSQLGVNVPQPKPRYFRSGAHTLFGWLHRPLEGRHRGVGIVICNPFGYEAICSHRSVRAFAEAATAAGMPVLRFDYAGTGDSTEADASVDQLEIWRENTIAAIRELQRSTGVKKVVLFGIRLGGLIAVLAGKDLRESVAGLVLIAPIISGRRYMRELRTTSLASMLGSESGDQAADGAQHASPLPKGSLEAGGFSLSPATIASVSRIDLNSAIDSPEGQLLVIDGESMPLSQRWAESLAGTGVRVDYKALPGLVQMLMTAPQFAKIPHEMILATREWLESRIAPMTGFSDELERGLGNVEPAAAPEDGELLGELDISDGRSTERPVFFGPGDTLFGIVTEPPPQEKRKRAVVLVNAGADYHVGANAMYVPFARRWAKQGYVVLRMDLSGIGDSLTRRAGRDDDVFPRDAVADMGAAIDLLRARYGAVDVTLVGLCSGAYHALRAAAEGLSVSRVLMINPQNYFWKEGMSINDMQVAELVRNPGEYRSKALSFSRWKRLLTGKVDLVYVFKVLQNRFLLTFESRFRDVARRLRVRLPHDLGRELQKIALRGVQMVFIFARNEPGIELLRMQAGSAIDDIGSRCRVWILESGDHVFSRRGPRASLEKVLDEELYARNVRAESARSGQTQDSKMVDSRNASSCS